MIHYYSIIIRKPNWWLVILNPSADHDEQKITTHSKSYAVQLLVVPFLPGKIEFLQRFFLRSPSQKYSITLLHFTTLSHIWALVWSVILLILDFRSFQEKTQFGISFVNVISPFGLDTKKNQWKISESLFHGPNR